ncbi:MAG: PocR ligand-binding domain-containing protein, partial [Desulfobacteraceae bacterium]|nr:PocR ligand-binding domain-containing protein [Desulfobacteraceae bacterium]
MVSTVEHEVLIHESPNSKIYRQAPDPEGGPAVIKVCASPDHNPAHFLRLKNEYEFLKNLGIEGVRKALSLTAMREKPALVMEYVPGETLRQAFVERNQPLTVFLRVAIRIAEILAQVHRQRIIHMNVSSENILADLPTGQVTLIDFGLASRLDSQARFPVNLEMLPGTLAYISPEQTGRMNRMVDYRTDLYSLGVTFYEMLAGRLPFESEDPLALVHAHMAKVPRPANEINPEVPQALSDIVLKLLSKNAEDRYQMALGLKADLERCLAFLLEPANRGSRTSFSFPLGQSDHSGRFLIPAKLYGRSKETAAILDAFERVSAGGREFLLVAGTAGVGKSALVAEIHKPVTKERSFFISGKFDQYHQNQPYSAFSHAFEEFADLLLSESGGTLDRWRERIRFAVDGHGAVLTEVMPALEKIIGKHPPVSKLSGAEKRNLLHLTVRNFVKAVSTADRPLVIFIDDWQWADTASSELLKVLITDREINYFLMIGAYRDSDVDSAHSFMNALREIGDSGIAPRTILLDNLKEDDVRMLVQESLSAPESDSRILAGLVFKKTRGNAFFTRQFLHTLHEEGWLRFDFRALRWTWDIGRIEAQNITDNVVELMAGKLRRLPRESARLLQLAACMGNEFDLRTLVLISQTSGQTALELLSQALAEGLLLPKDNYYKVPETAMNARFSFLHDRVQQAAYAQIPSHERKSVHLRIGDLLLANTPEAGGKDRLFSIVQHYNHSGDLLADPADRLKVAGLNVRAAQTAYEGAAFRSAQDYLRTALSLMPPDAWDRYYDLTLKIHSDLATVLCLTGDFVQMEQIFQCIETRARTLADTAHARQAKIQSLLFRGDYADGIELGLSFICGMGLQVHRDLSPGDALQYLHETAEWLTEERIESLAHLPEADSEVALILEVASAINGSLYNTNMYLFSVFVSRVTRLCIERGLTSWAPVNLMTFAILLSSNLHDIPKARLLASAAMDLLRNRYPSDSPISPMNIVIGGFIGHRHDHLGTTIPILAEGVQKGLSSGNFLFAGYCAWWHAWHLLFTSAPLADVESVCSQSAKICQKIQMERQHDWCCLVEQAVLNLEGKNDVPFSLAGAAYDVHEKLALAFRLNDMADVFRIFFYKAWLHYLFGKTQSAVAFFEEAESYLLYGAGTYLIPLFYLYDALAHAEHANDTAPEELGEIILRIKRNLKEIEVWARFAPVNHQHKVYLMQAECARLQQHHWDAVELYEKAIRGAADSGFTNEEALACELYGKFWVQRGKPEIARTFLAKARETYEKWGARGKAEHLEAAFRSYLGKSGEPSPAIPPARVHPFENAPRASWLDINSLIKASQNLSRSVRLSDLLEKMIEILLENAGAEKVLILHREASDWFVVAEGRVGENCVKTGLRLPVSEAGNLSPGVFNYVAHSGKAVVLEDGAKSAQFGAEDYLNEQEVKSVLCLPVYCKGRLDLVLYLENNLVQSAFTENRLEFLQLLSGHIAISFENALIYENLNTSITERKRAERTLKESEERLRMALEGASDGIWDWDLRTGQTYFSPRYFTMLGYDPDEYPSRFESWKNLLHPDDRDAAERAALRGIEEDSWFAIEFRMKAKNGDYHWILGRGKVAETDETGKAVRVAGSHTDITARKRAEEALQRRIVALTQPLDSAQGIAFEDMINVSDMQRVQDLLADAFGVAALMTRPDGTAITEPSNFSDLCKLIRSTPKGLLNCNYSDAEVGRHNPSGPNIQNCLSAGLCNAGTSITVGGRHIANWLIGQVRNDSQNEEAILEYCREIGADEEAFRAAYRRVSIMPQQQFNRIAHVLFAFANLISASAYQNVQQARFIAERNKAEESLRKYERIVSTSQDVIALISRDYVYEAVNDSLLR